MPVTWYGEELTERIRRAARQSIVSSVEDIRTEAISLVLEGEKTGRVYRRGGREHRASAPGEAPASDSGNLVNNITAVYNLEEGWGEVQANTEYAMRLEYGFVGEDSLGRSYDQAPRPFLRPALVNQRDAIVNNLVVALQNELGVE